MHHPKKDFYYSLIIFFIFISYSITLPFYIEGRFTNFLNSNEAKFADGRSALNFYNFINIFKNNSLAFEKDDEIQGIRVENYYDMILGKNDEYYLVSEPFFLFFYTPLAIFADGTIQLYKFISLENIFYAGLALIFFYKLQRILGLKENFALFSSLAMGTATGWLIYSKTFVDNIFIGFLFILYLYVFFNFKKNKSVKNLIFIAIIVSLLSLMKVPSFLGIFSFPIYLLIISPTLFLLRKSDFTKKSLSIFLLLFLIAFVIPELTWFKLVTNSFFVNPHSLIIERAQTTLFSNYPIFIDAESFNTYGYHNQSSEFKLERDYSYLYTFSEGKGNALFLHFYGIFASLFSSRGFVYNSPFLIFSILGLILYFKMKKKEANSLFLIVVINILIFAWLSFVWYGGSSPRYVKFYFPAIFLLNYFVFYYLEKNVKNKLILMTFLILFILSFLNVSSLSVRTDWTFEHVSDLVSYDLILWPINYQNITKYSFNDNLASYVEVSKWNFGGEGVCKAYYNAGIATDNCLCKFQSWAERNIKIERNSKNLIINACSKNSGDDGLFGLVKLDSTEQKFFIPSNSCENKIFNISEYADGLSHVIRIYPQINGTCVEEMIIWKNIKID